MSIKKRKRGYLLCVDNISISHTVWRIGDVWMKKDCQLFFFCVMYFLSTRCCFSFHFHFFTFKWKERMDVREKINEDDDIGPPALFVFVFCFLMSSSLSSKRNQKNIAIFRIVGFFKQICILLIFFFYILKFWWNIW